MHKTLRGAQWASIGAIFASITIPSASFALQTAAAAQAQWPNLLTSYAFAIQHKVESHWHYKQGLPGVCQVQVIQRRGGDIVQATIGSHCAFNPTDQQSLIQAVMDASPLPYKGYEQVFQSELVINFETPENPSPSPKH